MQNPTISRRIKEAHRKARHFALSALAVAGLGYIGLFYPLDVFLFTFQSMLNHKESSGSIVYVGLDEDPSDPKNIAARKELIGVIKRLKLASPKRIFIDIAVPKSVDPQLDETLGDSVAADRKRIVFIDRIVNDMTQDLEREETASVILGGSQRASNTRVYDFLGLSWDGVTRLAGPDGRIEMAPSLIAGIGEPGYRKFRLDYRIEISSIPAVTSSNLANTSALQSIRGKDVVVGVSGERERIPGHLDVPVSYLTIIAAETLKSGGVSLLPGWLPTIIIGFILFFSTYVRRPNFVLKATMLSSLSICLLIAVAPFIDVQFQAGSPIAFLFISAAIVYFDAQRHRGRRYNPKFDLPTFEALEEDLVRGSGHSALIVAKVQNFDRVLSAVGEEEQSEYVARLAGRFRVIEQSLDIHTNGEDHFAWVLEGFSKEELENHLRGIRALFSEPVLVHGIPFDVGVTFGVDAMPNFPASARIARARSAVDATNEADLPILFASEDRSPDRFWNLSLQYQVEKALAEGAIFPVFQPQFMIADGRLHGVEALVRWTDNERGVISPADFVAQCERAGRMEALTETVMRRAMSGMIDIGARDIRLSINISATLLSDFTLVSMVTDALGHSGFPANLLMLELTESWRISDAEVARAVMDRTAALGVRWSIDDFGVEAATMETLLRFPFDEIKIDRTFVNFLFENEKADAIIRSICSLGKSLKVDVVAEGVEDVRSLEFLSEAGCEIAQGFLLARPMPAADLAKFLKMGLPSANHITLAG